MEKTHTFSLGKSLISALSLLVFFVLDLADFLLCFVYRFLDSVLEESPRHCYCQSIGEEGNGERVLGDISETLYGRRNVIRQLGLKISTERMSEGKVSGSLSTHHHHHHHHHHRWSDCGCETCTSWERKGKDMVLHLVVKEPELEASEDYVNSSTENVIFLHGFLSSSSFWKEPVFRNLSDFAKCKLRMFAVDLLGFGRSPKPSNYLYTLEEHVEPIERSVLRPFQLNSFHLVAHSMGCIIAISLAAKHPDLVKSVTLISPPYFPSTEATTSHMALNRLAERSIWPPLLFASSVMSWYEHLGRTVCLIICKNHLKWEWIMKLITWKRDLPFSIMDLTKHTHHSAWHSMHNVICGGAKVLDKYLEVLKRKQIPIKITQGNKDQVVPMLCSYNMKLKVPHAELEIIADADHTTVILGREKEFTRDLESIWFRKKNCHLVK